MITKYNLEKYLISMGFIKKVETYEENNINICIDFENEKIQYPNDLNICGNQTTNFSHNENFVVLDCVIRLLRQGYHSKNIFLEQKWQLGRGASGGRADIQVKDSDGKSIIIIECKTSGKEFNKEWSSMKEDGGQLFSYLQQERDTNFVCLYTADFIDETPINEYYLIKVQDEANIHLEKGKKDYKSAQKVSELFSVWKNTYDFDYKTKGFLEEGIKPYKIGQKNMTIDDLQEVDSAVVQKKYNEYSTILRKYNVSGKENAFDKLVNLFLAKLIDEIQNTENKNQGLSQDLKFYWKGASYDDKYKLQDRLQKLYKDGMEKFLEEDVVYIENSQIDSAFNLFKNDPDATKEKIKDYFHQLKFYSNNDFSFIDVHNEQLFNQNFLILLDTIRMIQDIKLKNDNEQNFLGDLFEGFLNQGVKQSEGQFFTPQPIVRFIISSLPLENMVASNTEPLKVIDYACGAGHFLNEYGRQIKNFVCNPKEYFKNIVGIEKEYRLSKVSKVSAFMYGQDGIDIIYGDGLTNEFHKTKNGIKRIEDGTFDLVVANPPYSVDGFLETLTEEDRNKYEIFTSDVNLETCDAIQLFFIERTKQILKDNGIAAIILPSTVLTKNESIYTRTQKLILKYFDIVAICEMKDGTFWKTKTETNILFLRKKTSNPSLAEHYKYRIESWFKNDFSKDVVFEDLNLLEDYCKIQEMTLDSYIKKLSDSNETYKQNEREKLYYYLLARSNPSKVLILQTPNQKKDMKKFLGYWWSDRKGQEGLHYNNERNDDNDDNKINFKGINQIKTPLFDPNDLFNNQEKINSLIRNNFNNIQHTITESLYDYVKEMELVDLFNFKNDTFNSSFNLNADIKINIKSKFEYKQLGEIIEENNKSSIQVNENEENTTGDYPFFTSGSNVYRADTPLVSGENIYMATGGSFYINYYNGDASYSTDTYSFKTNENVKSKYLYELLKTIAPQINKLYFKGAGLKHLQKNELKEINIPMPNPEVQQKIIDECSKIDDFIKDSKTKIEKVNEKIIDTINGLVGNKVKLGNRELFNIYVGGDAPRNYKDNYDETYCIPIYSNGKNEASLYGYCKDNEERIVRHDCVSISARGTIGFVDLKKEPFLPIVRLICISPNSGDVDINYLKYAIQKETNNIINNANGNTIQQFTKPMAENIDISLPTIEEQKEISKKIKLLEKDMDNLKQEMIKKEAEKQSIVEKYLN